MYKFLREDPGFCRVYYKKKHRLYCIQNDGTWGKIAYNFYVCTKCGEPDCAIKFPDKSEFDILKYPV